MRHLYLLVVVCIPLALIGQQPQANLFTIPNQSAQFVRMPARHASQEIDGVFFNPAGTVRMPDGFHLSINNQILNQWTEVNSSYSQFREGSNSYSGHVTGFIFPSIYAAFNHKKWSFQAGFNMIGGSGGVNYNNLPVAERGISDIPQALITNLNLAQYDQDILSSTGVDPRYRDISDYRYQFSNDGLGFSPGLQLNIGYEVLPYLTVAAGARLAFQNQQASGYTSDIEIYNEHQGGWMAPGNYLRRIGAQTGNAFFNNIAEVYDGLAVDRQIDVSQSGLGITPIISVMASPTDKLNIAVKYEHQTRINLKTTVRDGKDGGLRTDGEGTIFTDGETIRSDLPGFIAAGISYQVTDKWLLATGTRYMFTGQANLNGREAFASGNYYELEFGTEYQIHKRFLLSGGYTWNHPRVDDAYQNEVDFWVPGHSFAAGGAYSISPSVRLNVGALYTQFLSRNYTYDNHVFAENPLIPVQSPEGYDNTYNLDTKKRAFLFAVGLDIDFRRGKMESNTPSSGSPNLDATDF